MAGDVKLPAEKKGSKLQGVLLFQTTLDFLGFPSSTLVRFSSEDASDFSCGHSDRGHVIRRFLSTFGRFLLRRVWAIVSELAPVVS